MRRVLAAALLALAGPASAQILGTDAQVGWPAGTQPIGQFGWVTPQPNNAGWGASLIKTNPQTVVHVGFVSGATNYTTASSSPCWTGNVVNSPHFLFFNMTCANNATTGPDGRPADQLTKSTTTGSFYRALVAGQTNSTTRFSSTVVGKHPTSTGYVGAQATCSAPPSACTCSACTTTDGSACSSTVACTAATNTNACDAYAAIDNSSWVKVSAVVTCSAPQTTITCAGYPGRIGADGGSTAYITDVMCQDSDPSSYIHTAGTSGTSIDNIGSISGMRPIKGAMWTQYGGVRQSTPVATSPAKFGVGPMIASHGYYLYPGVPNPTSLATFSACAVVVPTAASLAATNVLASSYQDVVVGGWQMVFNETGSARLFGFSAGLGAGTAAQAAAWSVGVPNLACWGFDAVADACYLRQNKGALATGAACRTDPDPLATGRLGTHNDYVVPFLGTIVEYWVSKETPSATVFSRIAAEVEARGGIVLP